MRPFSILSWCQLGRLIPLTLTAGVATLAPAFNVINGYDASLGFAEELKGHERDIGKAVIAAALLSALLIVVPLAAAVVAAPGLKAFLSDKAPVLYLVQQSLGSSAHIVVDIGVIIALFNSTVSLFMYYARGCYATGRDCMWPPAISCRLAQLNRFGAPGWGLLALFGPACVFHLCLSGLQLAHRLFRHYHRYGLFLHRACSPVESGFAARTVSCLSYAALATATAHCRELHGFRLDRAGNEIPNGRTGADRHGAGVLAWVEDMV